MANNTFLISTLSPEKPPCGKDRHQDRLLWANYTIPVFWHTLFDEGDLVIAPSYRGGPPYCALTTDTKAGLARSRERWPEMRRVLGEETDPLFWAWVGVIEANARAFLHCETLELAGLCPTRGEFERELRVALQAFAHLPDFREGRPILNAWWRMLLGPYATQGEDGAIRPVGDYGYCGIGWALKVPWRTTDD